MKTWFLVPAALLAAACTSGGPTPGNTAAPDGALAYAMPASNPVTYIATDTSRISLSPGGMAVEIGVNTAATVQMRFTPSASGLNTVVTFETLAGEFTNSMGPSVTIGDNDRPGPTTLTLSPRAVEVVNKPALSEAFQQVLGSDGVFHRMFVRLPGRAASPGDTWVDSLSITDSAAAMTSTSQLVIHSTLGPDTTVGGHRLKVIRSRTDVKTTVSGSSQGMDFNQQLTGTITGTALWDAARNLLVERTEVTESSGTMNLPTIGMSGLPVSLSGKSTIRLRGS